MAKKTIPVKAIEPLLKAETVTIKIDQLGDYDVVITDTIDMADALAFVDEVVENVIDFEMDTYYPELVNFLTDAEVLIRYANFKMPSDLSKQYAFIANNRDIVKTVIEYINKEQYAWIVNAIDEKINYMKSLGASTLASQFSELAAKLAEFSEQATTAFEGLSPEELSNAMRTLGNPDALDEKKIVKAVFDSQNK